MASTQAKLLQELADNIEKLRERGMSQGLSDLEIDTCMVKVLRRPDDVQRSRGKARTTRESICRALKLSVAALVVFFTTVYVVCSYSATAERIVGQLTQPLSYPLFRRVRLASLPFITRFDITKYYESSCLVANPWYDGDVPDCDGCSEVKDIKYFHNVTVRAFRSDFRDHWQYRPAVVMAEASSMAVSLDQIRDLFIENEAALTSTGGDYHCTDPRVNTPQHLFHHTSEGDIKQNQQFHASWLTQKMTTAQIIRKLFPRPAFFPKTVEVSVSKKIIVQNGQVGKQTMYPFDDQFPFAWYIQAQGKRHITLKPHRACAEQCKTVEGTLNPGESLYYYNPTWTLETLPVEGADDISVAFVGGFM